MKARLWKSKLVSGMAAAVWTKGIPYSGCFEKIRGPNNTYLCFVDLKKAYGCVWEEGLFRRMVDDGVPGKLLSLVKRWYKGARVSVNR